MASTCTGRGSQRRLLSRIPRLPIIGRIVGVEFIFVWELWPYRIPLLPIMWRPTGGEVYIYGSSTFRNSILANNKAGEAPDCYGEINTSDHNIIGNTSGCTVTAGAGNRLNTNPQLGSSPIGALGYYPLLNSSPAIDSGNPLTCFSTDQRGMSRTQGSACDIGAYEYAVSGAATSMGLVSGTDQRVAPHVAFQCRSRLCGG